MFWKKKIIFPLFTSFIILKQILDVYVEDVHTVAANHNSQNWHLTFQRPHLANASN